MDTIQMIYSAWPHLIVSLMVLTIGHAADYLFQADAWGWENPVWKNGYRAPKWGMWDFIPHDPLHIAQQIRNLSWIIGVFIISRLDLHWMWALNTALAANIIARGVGFSMLLKFIARR